jgi:hypothetical protein
MVWNIMEWCGTLWNGVEHYGMVWNTMEWCGTLWNGVEHHGMVWKDMEGHGMFWKGAVSVVYKPAGERLDLHPVEA